MNHIWHDHSSASARGGRSRTARFVTLGVALSLLVAGTTLSQGTQSASAADYPSWADVQAARGNVAAKQAEIARLDGLLAGLQSDVDSTQALAKQKGDEYQAALDKHDEAAAKLATLKEQADAAKATASESKQKAGQLAARLARTGGGDLSASLFFGNDSKDMLSQLGLATLVKGQSAGVYSKAVQDENGARSLSNQADRADKALKVLSDAAESAMQEANAASEKATAALAAQQDNKSRLEAQRAVLVDNQNTTEAQFKTGEAIRVEQARQAAVQKAAIAKAQLDAWNAAHPSQPAGVGGGGGGGGAVTSSGWVRPSGGRLGDTFGYRFNPASHVWRNHDGADLQPGCGAPIVAAAAGTVSFTGVSGGYGNVVMINHGGGLSTRYGHIVNGGFVVHSGQAVSAGQLIAYVGSTGNSTGCHLHFETRPGGTAVDPVKFMRDRGVSF